MFKHGLSNKGVSVVEYALLAALIGTASVLAVTTFGTQTAALFEREDLRLADSNGGGDNGSGGSTGSGDGLGDHRATQNLDMSLFRIVNINEPLNPSDAATKGYVDTTVASISTQGDDLGSHTATQNLDLATNRIVNLGAPQDPADATTKAYVDAAVAGIPGGDDLGDHTATQNVVLGDNWISNDGADLGLRVTSDGDVEVSRRLTIGSRITGGDNIETNNSAARFRNTAGNVILAGAANSAAIVRAEDGVGANQIVVSSDLGGTITASTAGAERLRIDNSGNVGIGVSPSHSLDVYRSGTTTSVVAARNDTSSGLLYSTISSSFAGTTTNTPFGIITSNAERLRVDTSGNVGIGTPSPADRLHVNAGSVRIEGATPLLRVRNTAATAGSQGWQIQNNNGLFFGTTTDTFDWQNSAILHLSRTGNVGIGTASPVHRLDVRGGGIFAEGNIFAQGQVFDFTLNPQGGSTLCRNATSGVHSPCSSDRRLKDNIVALEDAVLPAIERLEPVEFDWTNQEAPRQIGFIAQDVKALFPLAVEGREEDGFLAFAPGNLVPYVIKAVQELAVENKNLRAENDVLRDSLEKVFDRVSALESRLAND